MKNYMLLAVLLVTIFITGCGNNGEESQEGQVNVQNTTKENIDREESEEKAQRLAKLAEGIPEVNDATAIVIGNFAVIGIDVNQNLERSEVGSIKYSVAESMKHDPNGANAMVLADPDLTARLKEVAEDFRNGQPIQGIMNELADITGRIIPEIPADNLEPHPKNPTEEPKEKLNNNQEQQLDNTQNRQSNYHKNN